jgi:LDH2 family malate/lactate/ureidoglycolate dehydrogenase
VAKKDKEDVENVSIPTAYVNKLRENKKSTGVPIRTFICQAIDEKLKSQK